MMYWPRALQQGRRMPGCGAAQMGMHDGRLSAERRGYGRATLRRAIEDSIPDLSMARDEDIA